MGAGPPPTENAILHHVAMVTEKGQKASMFVCCSGTEIQRKLCNSRSTYIFVVFHLHLANGGQP